MHRNPTIDSGALAKITNQKLLVCKVQIRTKNRNYWNSTMTSLVLIRRRWKKWLQLIWKWTLERRGPCLRGSRSLNQLPFRSCLHHPCTSQISAYTTQRDEIAKSWAKSLTASKIVFIFGYTLV
jgi:hypothetical protein